MGVTRRDFLKFTGVTTAGLALPLVACRTARAEGTRTDPGGPAWDRYLLGSSYYPEWWDESEWQKDFGRMQELGFNAVRMGEFAWAAYEPVEGRFEFGWMDRAISLANRCEIQVILATPTASVPPWLRQRHRDVLGANEKGPFTYGGGRVTARTARRTSRPARGWSERWRRITGGTQGSSAGNSIMNPASLFVL